MTSDCRTAPANSQRNGRALREVLHRWSGHGAFDDAFAQNVASVRAVATAELDTAPWRD
jgi:hypothetical protein